MDGRRARNSRVIEELGHYDPISSAESQELTVKRDRVEHWLRVGAKPTDTVRQLLAKHGIGTDSVPSG
jgi:small subunit ribosomal protein S16